MYWLMTLISLFALQTESNFHKALYSLTTASKPQSNTEGANINSSVSIPFKEKVVIKATIRFSQLLSANWIYN